MDATVIDAQATVEGRLSGRDAQVLGRFKGEVELAGRLVLGEGGRLEATVKADSVEIAGEFKGKVTARSVTLLEKARVEATIEAQALVVREGAVLNGPIAASGRGKG